MPLVAASHEDAVARHIPLTDFQANRHTPADPLPVLLAATEVARVDLDFDVATVIGDHAEVIRNLPAVVENCFGVLGAASHGKDDDVRGGQSWRQSQPVIIAMRHDHGADQPRGHAPRRGPAVLEFAFFALVGDVLRGREVLAEEVRRAGLQRLAVLHHRLDAERANRARESLTRGLLAGEHRHRHPVLGEVRVDVEHALGFLHRLFGGCVRGVAFLPQKLTGAEKQPRPHFPPHDVGPLIDK